MKLALRAANFTYLAWLIFARGRERFLSACRVGTTVVSLQHCGSFMEVCRDIVV